MSNTRHGIHGFWVIQYVNALHWRPKTNCHVISFRFARFFIIQLKHACVRAALDHSCQLTFNYHDIDVYVAYASTALYPLSRAEGDHYLLEMEVGWPRVFRRRRPWCFGLFRGQGVLQSFIYTVHRGLLLTASWCPPFICTVAYVLSVVQVVWFA